MVIAPTRELAAQIASEAAALLQGMQLQVACIFGGVPYRSSNKTEKMRKMFAKFKDVNQWLIGVRMWGRSVLVLAF